MERVSVVIPTLSDHDLLRRVLDGFGRQDTSPGTFEVLVVADIAEPDPAAVAALVEDRPYPVRLLSGSRPGASANRNVGWRAARAPVVLFTDNDTVPVPSFVSEHLRIHAAYPEREVAVAGRVRWARALRVTPFMRWLDSGLQFDFGSLAGEEGTWAHLYTSNASVKRAMLELVGGFDEVWLPYGYEDLDWGYRAREHGLRVIYNRRAIVEHWQPMTLEFWQRRAPRLARSEFVFTRLHPDVRPYFRQRFAGAALTPAGRGLGARLAWVIPPWVPIVGPLVWERAALHWLQEIAPAFMAGWEAAEAEAGDAKGAQAGSERGSKPGGS